MPLRDHFAAPLKNQRHWGSFHATWATRIAETLNHGVLPDDFIAEPLVQWGGPIEIDVATQREAAIEERGSTAVATYAPPAAAVAIPVDWTKHDVIEIQVNRNEGGLCLVAAIELVSPANKERPSHRDAFVQKCLAYLRSGVSIAIVDVVTSRSANLIDELARAIGGDLGSKWSSIYAAAARVLPRKSDSVIEAWFEPLEIGGRLPTIPLWVAADMAAPLDLEETYAAACEALNISNNF